MHTVTSYTVPSIPFEIIPVNSHEVVCNGGGGALGHPKVYLHLVKQENAPDSVTCPYCSRQYVYTKGHN